jgi:hypothetical protein
VPFHRAHIASAKQMDLVVQYDRRHGAARTAEARNRCPLVRRGIVDKAL